MNNFLTETGRTIRVNKRREEQEQEKHTFGDRNTQNKEGRLWFCACSLILAKLFREWKTFLLPLFLFLFILFLFNVWVKKVDPTWLSTSHQFLFLLCYFIYGCFSFSFFIEKLLLFTRKTFLDVLDVLA